MKIYRGSLLITLFGLMLASSELLAAPVPSDEQPVSANEQPVQQPEVSSDPKGRIEVVFVVDTTGSMAGFISAAKEKIWSIATTLSKSEPAPEIRIGLLGYRDRGDEYVTKLTPLSTDLDGIYRELMAFQADGGNDAPESVNQALHEAVHNIGWSTDKSVCRIIYLVGDAPPHMDYDDDVPYRSTCLLAAEKGILINTIQCGSMAETTPVWSEIADNGKGVYAAIEQQGGAITPETPFDAKLAELSQRLDATRIYYGDSSAREKQGVQWRNQARIYEDASVRSLAQRAVFNCTSSGLCNFAGHQELVTDVLGGKTLLKDLDVSELPEELHGKTPDELEALILSKDAERRSLQKEVLDIGEQRGKWLVEELKREGKEPPELDRIIFDSIRTQLAPFGIKLPESALTL